jgi:LuxR family maltose regulon positive regulatory protein
LVSAPAGFGKTTLVAEWFAAGAGAAAWLSLDVRDNDPTTFWTYVVEALRAAAPDLGGSALSVLRSAPSDVDAVVVALVSDLDGLDDDVALVLDDYHLIDAAAVHESVAFLLDHLPPRVSLVIATRVDPPLPLARLRASGELVERRAADLRFTAEEAAEYFHNAMGLELSDDDIRALEARTEGWIAALQLAGLSMQGRDDVATFIESFTGDDRFVVDYLVEEVLERQPSEVRRFLLETSVLGRLTGGLCDAVTGGTSGGATLERLDRANLFVVPLDDRRLWYRYHHLFAEVLRARLLAEQSVVIPELHRRAAAWYAEHDDPIEAIGHAMAGGDHALAAELIELATPTLQRTRREALLRGWLEDLPDELFAARPVLSMALVGARMATGDPTGADDLLTGVERWFDDGGTVRGDTEPIVVDRGQFARLPAQAAVQRAGLALLSGDLEETIGHASRVLTLVQPGDHLQRGAATALLGLAHWSAGDLESARADYASAIDDLVQAGHLADALGCTLTLADLDVALGHLDDAMSAFTAGLELVGRHPGLRGLADMHVGLCELHLERDELDAAREHLDASRALGEHAGLPQHPYRWRVAAALLRVADGDHAGALALLEEAAAVYDTDYSPSVRPIPALVARFALARGDLDAALRWAERRGLTAGDELDYVTEFEHLTLARTLVALETRDRTDAGATGLLERLSAAAEAGGRAGVLVEALVLLSAAHQAHGDRSAAVGAVERALELAAAGGFVRVFVEGGPGVHALLRSLSVDGPAGAHLRRVLAAFTGDDALPARPGLVDELSGRELEVLRLLRSELSGPEIARELVVSLNTMRTHTKNIYAKLGATNRREAVRRADELGL